LLVNSHLINSGGDILKKIFTYLFVALILGSSAIYAGGFQLNEHGAKAVAMGGAFTAVSNDPSAVYWNGAGLSFIRGTHFMLSTHAIQPKSSFRGVLPAVDEYKLIDQTFFPVNFFASHYINDQWAIGFGFTVPFGLGTKWDDEWIGRYLAVETELQVLSLSPVVSFRPVEQLAISAGFVYNFANVLIERKNPQTPFQGDATIHLEGDDKAAFGYNLGLMYKPTDKLTLGVSYHSQVEYDFEGTATSTGAQQLIDAKRLPMGDIKAKLTTPFNLAFGVAYQLLDDLLLSADFQLVGWSSYDTLAVDFVDPAYTDVASPRMYEDSYFLRFGLDYKVNTDLSIQGGIYFDKNPVPVEYLNPSLPETDRLGFSIGAEYKLFNNLGLRGSYLFIRGSELRVENSKEYYSGNSGFNGVYTTYANVFSLSLLYSL